MAKIDVRRWVERQIASDVKCSEEENKSYRALLRDGKPLPDGVSEIEYFDGTRRGNFKTSESVEISIEEARDYLLYKQTNLLEKIKSYLFFFVVLAATGIVAGIVLTLVLFL